MTIVDWPAIITDIAHLLGDEEPGRPTMRTPLGTRGLADKLQRARSTIRGWRDGAEPSHSDGEMLLDRWCSLTGKAHAFAPRTKRQLSAADLK